MNLFVKFFQYHLISLCKYDILFLGKKDGYIETEGKVLEIIPGGDFKVKLENGHIVEARVSGKMRLNLIRILPGDTVLLEIPICDLTRGRIIYRK